MKQFLLPLAVATSIASIPVQAETVADLSGWVVDGDGNWTYTAETNSWYQSDNTPEFSYLYDPSGSSLGKAITGTISVTGNDDDMIGFVVGYDSGENASAEANYLLMSWKGGAQSGWDEGMTLWHITDSMIQTDTSARGDSFWEPNTNDAMTLMDRATNYSNTGWVRGESYKFDIAYNGSYLAVFVNDVLEMSIAPGDAGMNQFEEGSFGFYNFSQGGVTYDGVNYDNVDVLIDDEMFANLANAVPFHGAGLAAFAALGLFGFRRRK